jgi:hypothetical protein
MRLNSNMIANSGDIFLLLSLFDIERCSGFCVVVVKIRQKSRKNCTENSKMKKKNQY